MNSPESAEHFVNGFWIFRMPSVIFLNSGQSLLPHAWTKNAATANPSDLFAASAKFLYLEL